jgi:SAM-dependent methyltransferase
LFRSDLLPIVRPQPADRRGLVLTEGEVDAEGGVSGGTAHSAETGKAYRIRSGYLDLLGSRVGDVNVANLTNYLPGAGRLYEPLWRTRSLTLLTGDRFPNEREAEKIGDLAAVERGGLFLDLGCSAGLYTRSLQARLGPAGHLVGVDLSPSMLKEAVRRSAGVSPLPSYVRADAVRLPFADAIFAGAVCGGTLNELKDPARVLREVRRVLRPGARLAIMGILAAATPNGRRLQRFLSTGGIQFFHPEPVASLLTHVGLVPDPLESYGSVFFVAATRQ